MGAHPSLGTQLVSLSDGTFHGENGDNHGYYEEGPHRKLIQHLEDHPAVEHDVEAVGEGAVVPGGLKRGATAAT